MLPWPSKRPGGGYAGAGSVGAQGRARAQAGNPRSGSNWTPQCREMGRTWALLVVSAVRSHGVLDGAFRENDPRARRGHANEHLAVVRQEQSSRVGIPASRLQAGWDHASLLHMRGEVSEMRLSCALKFASAVLLAPLRAIMCPSSLLKHRRFHRDEGHFTLWVPGQKFAARK
jgi:hypothetical protein